MFEHFLVFDHLRQSRQLPPTASHTLSPPPVSCSNRPTSTTSDCWTLEYFWYSLKMGPFGVQANRCWCCHIFCDNFRNALSFTSQYLPDFSRRDSRIPHCPVLALTSACIPLFLHPAWGGGGQLQAACVLPHFFGPVAVTYFDMFMQHKFQVNGPLSTQVFWNGPNSIIALSAFANNRRKKTFLPKTPNKTFGQLFVSFHALLNWIQTFPILCLYHFQVMDMQGPFYGTSSTPFILWQEVKER